MARKQASTAYILCALGFLGIGGIHRFYLNRAGTGLVYLFTYGIFGVGTVVDMFSIQKMVDEENLYKKALHNNGNTYNNNSPQVVINLGENSQYNQVPSALENSNTSQKPKQLFNTNLADNRTLKAEESLELKILKICREKEQAKLSDCVIDSGANSQEVKKVIQQLVNDELLIVSNRDSDGAIVYQTI